MNKKRFDILYVALIVGLLLFMGFVVVFMQKNAGQCLRNPIGYFEEKNEGSTCVCYKGINPYILQDQKKETKDYSNLTLP